MKQRTELIEIDGVWTLLHDGRIYAKLLDARSRDDAEMQIAEMRIKAIGIATPYVRGSSGGRSGSKMKCPNCLRSSATVSRPHAASPP